jgi:hypothetical protein
MKLMAVSLAICVLAGYLAGGRLTNLSKLRLHWAGLAILGFALQFVAGPGTVIPLTCLYGSFVLLTIFAVRNWRITGFPIILLGIALNFTVIGLNLGMPVARQALTASGQADALDDLIHNPWPKHHLASGDDIVVFLGDVIALPPPVAQAISIGDIFTYVGVGVVIVAGMGPTRGRKPARPELPDRGEVQHAGS